MPKQQSVAGDITPSKCEVQDLHSDKVNGVIISMHHGECLSDDAGVTKLYAEMGQVFAPLKTWVVLSLTVTAFDKYGSPADKNKTL